MEFSIGGKEDKADQEQDRWNQPTRMKKREGVGGWGRKKMKLQHKNALCTWAKMNKYIRKIFKNNMNKYMNSSWKTFLCCYGESGKRITQVYKYHIQTRLQYKTVIHNYIKIVNFKFIFNNFILLFQLADFYGCLIHSLFNAAPYEMFYLTWIIAQPPKQLCERKQK